MSPLRNVKILPGMLTNENQSHITSSVDYCRIIKLRSSASSVMPGVESESLPVDNDTIPFTVRRVYYIYDVPAEAERGGHSHHKQQSVILAVVGAFTVKVHDGVKSREFRLSRPWEALFIPEGIWREIHDYAAGSVTLSLASTLFDENDYVRSFNDFLSLTAPKRTTTP